MFDDHPGFVPDTVAVWMTECGDGVRVFGQQVERVHPQREITVRPEGGVGGRKHDMTGLLELAAVPRGRDGRRNADDVPARGGDVLVGETNEARIRVDG